MREQSTIVRKIFSGLAALSLMAGSAAVAQIQSVDPNDVIDGDLDQPVTPPPATPPATQPWTTEGLDTSSSSTPTTTSEAASGTTNPVASETSVTEAAQANGATWRQDDLIGAAEGVFGRGAEGLARLIEGILRDQGEPNGYIVGREAGGALVVGLRYGSGTLYHRIEGEMPVYWTGPSIGFDAGANAGNTFILVYNLHDTADLYHRIPAGEGAAYLIGAAEGVFGRGAEGLARLIEGILRDQGEPNGYIVGREAGGALVVGLRYGSGTLYHRIEGEMPVYWTGPSIGFDAGANAGNTFILVYNLHDTADLYHRIPAGEGAAYLIGGFNASYLRRGNIVLIPIRMGVGARLGVNVGYMKFSRRQRWLPL